MKQKKKKKLKMNRLLVVLMFLIGISCVYTIMPNYHKIENNQFTIFYHNENKTYDLKQEAKIQQGQAYIEMEDVHQIFGQEIYLDETKEWIVTVSPTKVAAMNIDHLIMEINSAEIKMDYPIICEQDKYYIPISELEKVYNIETQYIKESNTEWIDPKDQELISADINKKTKVKSEKKTMSATIETLKKGESVILISNEDGGWAKIRTQKGNIGYIKKKRISNLYHVRENMEETDKIIDEDVTITKFNTLKKVKKVKLTDIQQYKSRQTIIEKIVDECVVNQVSCLEFQDESLQKQDETSYQRFRKELEAQLAEVGIELK